jgi:hypothetical protein
VFVNRQGERLDLKREEVTGGWRRLHNAELHTLYSSSNTTVYRDSSVGVANRYGLDSPGMESRWGRIFRTRPDRPWGPPSLLYNGYRVSFPGVKRPRRGVDHQPSSSARVKERVQLCLYSPSGPSWPILGRTWPLPSNTIMMIKWNQFRWTGHAGRKGLRNMCETLRLYALNWKVIRIRTSRNYTQKWITNTQWSRYGGTKGGSGEWCGRPGRQSSGDGKNRRKSIYGGSGGTDPHVLNLITIRMWVITVTPRPLCPRGKSLRYLLNRRLGGPRAGLDALYKRKIFRPCRESDDSSEVQPVAKFRQ